MTSNDNQQFVTITTYNAGNNELKTLILSENEKTRREFTGALKEIGTEVRINSIRIEEVKNSMNWDFATLALVVAIVGFTITLAPMFRELFSKRKEDKLHDDIQKIAREVMRTEINEAVKEVLSNSGAIGK